MERTLARRRHLPRAAGHVAGVGAVRSVVRASIDTGLSYLTLYAFSSENWKRPPTGSDPFDGLFRAYFREDVDELVERNVRMRIIGSRQRAESDILRHDRRRERRTAQINTGLNLTFAFDYGAQEEIVAAAREMAQAAALGELDPDAIHAGALQHQTPYHGLPNPDLLIRTSGEHRLSNFSPLAVGLCGAGVRRHALARLSRAPICSSLCRRLLNVNGDSAP